MQQRHSTSAAPSGVLAGWCTYLRMIFVEPIVCCEDAWLLAALLWVVSVLALFLEAALTTDCAVLVLMIWS